MWFLSRFGLLWRESDYVRGADRNEFVLVSQFFDQFKPLDANCKRLKLVLRSKNGAIGGSNLGQLR